MKIVFHSPQFNLAQPLPGFLCSTGVYFRGIFFDFNDLFPLLYVPLVITEKAMNCSSRPRNGKRPSVAVIGVTDPRGNVMGNGPVKGVLASIHVVAEKQKMALSEEEFSKPGDDKNMENIRRFAESHGCKLFPRPKLLRRLVQRFFQRIAVSRILGFLHEPTFIQGLDGLYASKDLDELMVLLGICASASKVSYFDDREIWDMGIEWAKDLSRLLMASLNVISDYKLPAVVLLHEHEYRVGNISAWFLFGCMLVRYTQILQLNVEYDIDVMVKTRTADCL